MIRILNFFCFALTGLACLALYHVSEETRVARVQLAIVQKNIAGEHDAMKVLQADWERVSEPGHIQTLAATRLGLGDTPTVALASLELLPRRGQASPLGGNGLSTASAEVPPADPHLRLVAAHVSN
jgi:hypothetical protein